MRYAKLTNINKYSKTNKYSFRYVVNIVKTTILRILLNILCIQNIIIDNSDNSLGRFIIQPIFNLTYS